MRLGRTVVYLATVTLAALVVLPSAKAQTQANTHVATGSSLPASCRAGDLFYKTGTSAGLYACSASNTWSLPPASGVTGTVPVANGGTGQTSYTNGQLLIGNTTGNTLTKATLTAGSGVTITNGGGSITIAAASSGGVTRGTFASLPSPSTAGAVYYFTDSVYDFAYDTGSAWEYYRDGKRMYDPNLQSWSWVNQGSASVSTANGGIRMTAGVGSISNNVHLYVKTAPTPPYTVTIAFIADYFSVDYMEYGAGWRDSAAGFVSAIFGSRTWGFANQNRYLAFAKWTNPTTYSAAYPDTSFASKITGDSEVRWMQLVDDNTNRQWNVSYDKGVTWHTLYSTSRTDFITPNQLWFGFNQYNSARAHSMTLLSWQE